MCKHPAEGKLYGKMVTHFTEWMGLIVQPIMAFTEAINAWNSLSASAQPPFLFFPLIVMKYQENWFLLLYLFLAITDTTLAKPFYFIVPCWQSSSNLADHFCQ
jgi:hypothetical protein